MSSVDVDAVKSAVAELRLQTPPALGKLLALLAHDLRNPLAALMSNASYLGMVSRELSPDGREALEDIQLSVEALGRIIDSLEVVSHELQQRKLPVPMPVAVESIMKSVEDAACRAAQSHGVKFEINHNGHARQLVQVSGALFERAVGALIHNGISASPPGSTVVLNLEAHGPEMRFCLEDSGPVLALELEPMALSAAAQAEIKTSSGARYSRGLGLYVASRCAENAGARFVVDRSQAGSRILLCAPLAVST